MRMIASFVAAILITLTSLQAPARATETAEAAFRQVITGQIQAFRDDKAVTAFSYATPAMQSHIGSPLAFMAMVRRNYAPLFLPHSFKFGEVTDEMGIPTQRVHVVGPHGRPWLALYGFEKQHDGKWRIAGVVLQPAKAEKTVAVEQPVAPAKPVDSDGPLVATLAPKDGDAQFVVSFAPDKNDLQVIRVGGAKPEDKDFELWLIVGKEPPVSLGLVGGVANKAPAVPAKLQTAFAEGATLAISVEPTGGSTTGAPTGPVVATGPVKKI